MLPLWESASEHHFNNIQRKIGADRSSVVTVDRAVRSDILQGAFKPHDQGGGKRSKGNNDIPMGKAADTLAQAKISAAVNANPESNVLLSAAAAAAAAAESFVDEALTMECGSFDNVLPTGSSMPTNMHDRIYPRDVSIHEFLAWKKQNTAECERLKRKWVYNATTGRAEPRMVTDD